jgi:hypothetical protein
VILSSGEQTPFEIELLRHGRLNLGSSRQRLSRTKRGAAPEQRFTCSAARGACGLRGRRVTVYTRSGGVINQLGDLEDHDGHLARRQ